MRIMYDVVSMTTRANRNYKPIYKPATDLAQRQCSMEDAEASREVVSEAKTISELLARLQESLTRAADKNDSLLEAIEATEARATLEGQGNNEVSKNCVSKQIRTGTISDFYVPEESAISDLC